ncbi:MAG: histidine kinase [Rubrivivax sp.]|nr:histidine kinase [Rubrivivax sp.]
MFETAAAARPAARALKGAPQESAFESLMPEMGQAAGPRPWMGWRRRALAGLVLVACVLAFAMVRWLAGTPQIDAQWAGDARGGLQLLSSRELALQGLLGQSLLAIGSASNTSSASNMPDAQQARQDPQTVDALLLHRSPRWQASEAARVHQIQQHEWLAGRLASGEVTLHFANGRELTVPARKRGYAGLGWLLWPLIGLSLLLALFAGVVLLARLQMRNALFAVMSLCQAGNLLFIALESTRGLGLPLGVAPIDLDLRLALDAVTGAAIVHAFLLHPRRLPHAAALATAVWLAVGLALLLIHQGLLGPRWWAAQSLCVLLGLAALLAVSRSYGLEPNPYALVMRRFALMALATLLLVTGAVAAASSLAGAQARVTPGLAYGVAIGASVAWYLFLASLLLLTPFLARSRQLLREFALLAGISTVAASVDLLFITVFSLGAFTSLAVAVFAALAVYAGARQYILAHMLGTSLLTTERTFDYLYRAAREVQARPQRHSAALGQLLRDLFEPLQLELTSRVPPRSRVVGAGAGLVIPVRAGDDEASSAFTLRFAQRGQRLFTQEDARLAERVVDQLRRAVAYDQAVERGRHEERQRLAQDLHDDIGARLLTLMYQAPDPAMEDYIRHTLQDLKTLTRGLAAAEHRLSHAAGEWKADLTQRLTLAQAQLGWICHFDQDLALSVVQWSALTRVLRELVTNALYHGHASRIDVTLHLAGPLLELTVTDDGCGRDPQAWAHGLGLGGVRKRVKALGGRVQWRENQPIGIVCDVRVEQFHVTA